MTVATNPPSADLPEQAQPHLVRRIWAGLVARYRPWLGWLVLFTSMGLAALPAQGLGENRVAELARMQAGVGGVGPLAVLVTWLWLGWRRPRALTRWWLLNWLFGVLLLVGVGLLVLGQALVQWLPTVTQLASTVMTGQWAALGGQIVGDWVSLGTRFSLWWQGVQAGGAAQDNLIFAALAGALFWGFGLLTAWLVRRFRQGLPAAAPLLWLLGTILLYSGTNRSLMVAGVLLALLLHILLDQQRLVERWEALRLDYNPDLRWDRFLTVALVAAVLFLLAGLMPNLYSQSLVTRYYRWIAPVDQQLEAFQGRLFPDLTGISRLRGRGDAAGLPNAFLLGGGGTLGQNVVMHVRTNDAMGYEGLPYETSTPPAHYMRGATLSTYDGHGWSNPNRLSRQPKAANERWADPTAESMAGRKLLVQSVTLFTAAAVLYAAPEPLEPGVDYEAEARGEGDLVAIWQRARHYTVVSTIPAVSEAMLAAQPAWGAAEPLPPGYALHLALPESITDRTRQLAAELTANEPTAFGKARAIEQFLRQYTYDLAVPSPPTDVVDIVDYFLFDLQRGYCDYYATAFVVLARLAGLPARFATGYAPGYWDYAAQVWVITEEQAHSWPEVYFPTYGWIPFEPTAGRPELARVGTMPTSSSASLTTPRALPPASATPTSGWPWNWQMLFWLLPLLLAGWGGWIGWQQWRRRYEDPWVNLLHWGRRLGRPLAEGETVLEYGAALAAHVTAQQQAADAGRVAAREILALSQQVNALRYAPAPSRPQANIEIRDHWARLRDYLPQLQRSR
ncbi:MAG: transglutaminase domain-containing protein [Caldilineaceae bacterium]|nr:transglutaminase domain-containing protein [Caldilineaceae bacterium]